MGLFLFPNPILEPNRVRHLGVEHDIIMVLVRPELMAVHATLVDPFLERSRVLLGQFLAEELLR